MLSTLHPTFLSLLTFQRSPPLSTDTTGEEGAVLGTPQARRVLHLERGEEVVVLSKFSSSFVARVGQREKRKK